MEKRVKCFSRTEPQAEKRGIIQNPNDGSQKMWTWPNLGSRSATLTEGIGWGGGHIPWAMGSRRWYFLKISRRNCEHALAWLGSVFKLPQEKWELLAGIPVHYFYQQKFLLLFLSTAQQRRQSPSWTSTLSIYLLHAFIYLLAPFSSLRPPSPLLLHWFLL